MDIVVANAGVSQEGDYFADTFTEDGDLAEPKYAVFDVNVKATLNVVKLALRAFRVQFGERGVLNGEVDGEEGLGGSLVLTSSATAYSPEWSLPVYSAGKMAVSLVEMYFFSLVGYLLCSFVILLSRFPLLNILLCGHMNWSISPHVRFSQEGKIRVICLYVLIS